MHRSRHYQACHHQLVLPREVLVGKDGIAGAWACSQALTASPSQHRAGCSSLSENHNNIYYRCIDNDSLTKVIAMLEDY
jgi:hypothetical protein